MRIFATCREMMSEMNRDIHEMGTLVHPQTMQDKDVRDDPAYRTLELSPAVFMVLDGSDRDAMVLNAKGNLKWCEEDFKERVGIGGDRINPGKAWMLRRETWEPFIHNGEFAYTYSERINRRVGGGSPDDSALERIMHELEKNPSTRQAILPIFNADLDTPNMGGKARIPCSLHYQFMRRRDQLDMIYVMRSSDFHTHFVYDIWMALELLAYVADELGVPVGRFTFFSGSLHIYQKDADLGAF
jgi:thymidylate synthase